MARFRKIDSRLWNDAKFRALSDDAKLVFFLLLTHPHLTSLGAMRGTAAGLAAEISWDVQRFAEGFREVSAKGMAEFDSDACLIALPNFIRYNKPESPNVVKAWAAAFDLLPECELKTVVIKRARGLAGDMSKEFAKAFPKGLLEGFDKAMPNQEPEPEPEQEKTSSSPSADAQVSGAPVPLSDESESTAQRLLNHIWRVYVEKLGRNPKAYTFTASRRRMGMARVNEALKMADGSADKAKALLEIAVEQLALSDFHNARGKYVGGTKYNDWDIIFRSAEQFEKFLERSNDPPEAEKPSKPKIVNAAERVREELIKSGVPVELIDAQMGRQSGNR